MSSTSTYLSQIVEAFRDVEGQIAKKLLTVQHAANSFALQQDYLSAATLYEMLIKEIFERSHLYEGEEEEYDDYYEEEYGHPEEEGLEKLVQECIEELAA